MKKSLHILPLLLLYCVTVCAFSQNEAVLPPLGLRNFSIDGDDCDLCPGDLGWNVEGAESSSFTNTYLKSDKQLCRYAPKSTTDGNPATAWVEGAKGSGIGAEIIIPRLLDLNRPVELWAGYGKSETLFYANNRPKKVLVSVLKAKGWGDWFEAHDATGCSGGYGAFQVAASHTVLLKDFNGYQELKLPHFVIEMYRDFPEVYYRMDGTDRHFYEERVKAGGEPIKEAFWDYAYFLKLEILEVYKGTKYDDTCISEIKN